VFVQLRARADGRLVVPPSHVKTSEVASRLASEARGPAVVVVAGEAARDVDWSPLAGRVELVTEPPHDLPRASVIGRIAHGASPVDADALEPLYVRPPEITMPRGAA
jgi:hypothetical protein